MKLSGTSLLCGIALLPCVSIAFAPQHLKEAQRIIRCQQASPLEASRRDFMSDIVQKTAVIGITAATLSRPEAAMASGGATAGGAYLLSAKQRYNERVKAGVTGFLGIKPLLESGDVDALRNYFGNEDMGGWKDFTAAGYLLANAFRRSSTTPPDSLPSVKAWKKFAGSVEGVAKALKKKDIKGANAAYNDSMVLLDEYLKQVELPDAKEISA